MRNVSFAVCADDLDEFAAGSPRPGTWTRMRSTPCRWIDGSTVPISLRRRSRTWIDCSTAWRTRSTIAGSVSVSRITPLPASTTSTERWPVARAGRRAAATARGSFCKARVRSTPSRTRNSTVLPRIATRRGCRDGCRAPRGGHRRAAHRPCPCEPPLHRPRAGCARRPADRGRARRAAVPTLGQDLNRLLREEIRDGESADEQRHEQNRRMPSSGKNTASAC